MSTRTLEAGTRALLRAAISDAYYEARNHGRTMEAAADDAVEALAPIIASIDANAHGRGARDAVAAVHTMAERASRKGYELDPAEVLEAIAAEEVTA